ncbi:MAG: family 10 glycosylhydrolase [Bacteroidales bacterium]|nr:family 10 glycosylhydrolase [Bacteroidales bacterium]
MKLKTFKSLYNIMFARERFSIRMSSLHTLCVLSLLLASLLLPSRLSAQQYAAPFPIQNGVSQQLYPKRESRAVWLGTVYSLDWPRNKATSDAGRERQKKELCDMLDKLKSINMNTILLQTRVRSTTIYPSEIEPWDACLTGRYGQDPGYDPLQFAVDECHKRGMELHAWIVTFPVYKMDQAKQMGSTGLHVKHPELVKKHGEQYYLDPGIPGTEDYLVKVCSEIVSKYDVDGIHFDYVRYPEKAATFADADTYAKYGKGQNKAQWRRDNVTRVVRAIYKRVHELKPWIRVSSSPVGKYRDVSRFSSKGWNCYDAVHQDAQGWLREGIHDALYPMMYFKGDHFYPFAADWSEKTYGRINAPGLGAYLMAGKERNWPLSDVTNELYYLRALGLSGQCYFRAQNLTDNTKGLYDFLHDTFYAHPALTPAATWLDSIAPSSPTNFRTEKLANGMARLTWDPCTDNVQAGGVRYNVYVSRSYPVDATKAENLVAMALQEPSYTYNPKWTEQYGYHILVTAMDRFGNESKIEEVKSGQNFDADFAQRAERYGCVKADAKGNVSLPESNAEYYAVTDLQGRILLTGRYTNVINISPLPSGWYLVRTLNKSGLSHVVQKVWKKNPLVNS